MQTEEEQPTSVKEHVSDNCRLFVNFEGMPTQHYSFADDSVWVNRKQRTSGHQNMSATWQWFEDHNRLRGVAHRSKDSCHHRAVRMEELFELKMFNEVELVDPSSAGDSLTLCLLPVVCCEKIGAARNRRTPQ